MKREIGGIKDTWNFSRNYRDDVRRNLRYNHEIFERWIYNDFCF